MDYLPGLGRTASLGNPDTGRRPRPRNVFATGIILDGSKHHCRVEGYEKMGNYEVPDLKAEKSMLLRIIESSR